MGVVPRRSLVVLVSCLALAASFDVAAAEPPSSPKSDTPSDDEPGSTARTPTTEPAEKKAAKPVAAPDDDADASDDEDDASGVGRPCDDQFFKPCPGDLVCTNQRCAVKADENAEPAPKKTAKKKRTRRERVDAGDVRALRLGVQSTFWMGIGGRLDNPSPAYDLTADFGFPTGRTGRWHFELGYRDLNGWTGLRVNPFVLGFAIPVYEGDFHLEIEILAAIIQSEVLFGDGFSIALSSGLRSQLVLVYGVGFAALAPIGFEIRYAYGVQDIGIDTGVGANWPIALTVGLEL
ncbi:hypothetical protein L6R52_09125 [Myxococcota bacterium]|nr:hypothetical protein [Myxococcota bacterium]